MNRLPTLVRRYWLPVVVVVLVVVILLLIVWATYLRVVEHRPWADWTGFGPHDNRGNTDQYDRGKTLWDWLQLLIVPVMLAAAGLWFNTMQHRSNEKRAELQRESDEQRAETESGLAEDRQQEAALQGYLDKMTDLLLEHKLSAPDAAAEVKVVARSRTLTTLRMLDRERQGLLVRFLHESGLINQNQSSIPLIDADLRLADLQGADLQGADLQGAELFEANLSGANLNGANLNGADLLMADLRRAHLRRAHLRRVDLRKARLQGADLSESDLSESDLDGATLEFANLGEAVLTASRLSGVGLADADLRGADLRGANLNRAILFRADLRGADLRGAKLFGVDLRLAKYDGGTQWPERFAPPPDAQHVDAESA